ncbi:hypothetical protein CR513_36015, partial [Mucuna pruriens]
MLSHTTWLVAKTDPIKYIFEKPALTGQITLWQIALFEYDITYVSQSAIKGSVLAEHLAYHPLMDPQPLFHEFPDEHIMTTEIDLQLKDEWTMWFDRASNLLGNGIEYEACTMGLLMALEHQVKRLKVLEDSTLVIYQLRGEWETRDTKLIPYHNHVKEIMEAFDGVTFHHVPQEENQMADALATCLP